MSTVGASAQALKITTTWDDQGTRFVAVDEFPEVVAISDVTLAHIGDMARFDGQFLEFTVANGWASYWLAERDEMFRVLYAIRVGSHINRD